jgi:hypothetical protein
MTSYSIRTPPILASDSNHGLFTCQRFNSVQLSEFVKSFALTGVGLKRAHRTTRVTEFGFSLRPLRKPPCSSAVVPQVSDWNRREKSEGFAEDCREFESGSTGPRVVSECCVAKRHGLAVSVRLSFTPRFSEVVKGAT